MQEVDQALSGGIDGIACGMEHLLLHLLLESEQREHIVASDIFHPYGDGDTAVGIRGVASMVAHPIHHLLPKVGGCRHDDPSRAHAE